MPANAATRPAAAIAAIVVGSLLLALGALDASATPMRAHRAFDTLVQAQGGSMAHSPTYPDTYRTIAANALLLRAALVGATGVALVAIGAAAVADARRAPTG